jgi:tetratricopeptide (TPR) repeat protein
MTRRTTRRALLMEENSHEKPPTLLICLGLALAVLAAYAPVWNCDYVGYDDPVYVTANPAAQQGVNWESIRWAFTNTHAGLWHPLTWISFLVDYQLYGMNPVGRHATSLFLHLANSVFLFVLLRRMTNAPWPSALTAAFFALHPLHVESVAWIAERKDVLSTFFWMPAVWFYVRYTEEGTEEGSKRHVFYLGSVFIFALALMAKPMVVTLPFILLLLDYWPLQRSQLSLTRLLVEKIPFCLLAAGACVVTLLFVHDTGGLLPVDTLPLRLRLGYIPIAYLRYMAKTFWPVHLDIFYPYPAQLPFWQVGGAAMVLLLISGWVFARARAQPWLIVGWLWFLGALSPAIGLVQAGNAAMSDHHTYIPIVGLFVMVVWPAREWRNARAARSGAWLAGLAVAACLVLTPLQVSYWQNDAALYSHAVAVSRNNYLAYYNWGCDLAEEGETAAAIGYFQKAIECSGKVILTQPDQAFANLGIAFAKQGRVEEAISQFRLAIALGPGNPYAQNGLGRVLETQNKWDEAAAHYMAAISAKPDFAEGHENLGVVLSLQGRFQQAEEQFTQALRLQPDSATSHFDLGNTLLRQNKPREAAVQYAACLRLRPEDLQANLNLALVFTQLGQTADAIPRYRAAVHLNPKDVQVMKRLAWLLATDPDPHIRQAPEALQLASRAVQLAPGDPLAWDTQGAALAEAGQFPEAAAAAGKALDLAAAGQKDLIPKIQGRLHLYQSGAPYHEAVAK